MDELYLIKNLLSLSGVSNPNLKKTLSMLETMNKINKQGMNEECLCSLLSQVNPKVAPLFNIIKSEKREQQERQKDDFVQYNRPE